MKRRRLRFYASIVVSSCLKHECTNARGVPSSVRNTTCLEPYVLTRRFTTMCMDAHSQGLLCTALFSRNRLVAVSENLRPNEHAV